MRIDVPGMTAMKTLRIQERGGAVMSNDEVTYANGYFQFPIRPGQLGRNYDVYFEALGGSPQGVIYIGKGAYEVSASGTATYRATEIVYRQSVLNLTATSASDRMAVRLRQPGGGFTEWLPVTGGVDRTFILDAYKPASGGPATYEFEYKVEDEFGTVMLKKGHGSFTLAVDGKVAMGAVISDRTPLAPITFYGPNDPAAAKLRLTIDGRTIELAGTWNGRQMQYVWARPFDGAVIETERRYPYTMEILTASGQPAEDAVGETIPAVQGVMTVAANGGDQPFRFEQLVQQVNQSAQVRRFQTYNAFGEIAEEYDDSTLARARAMAQQYADFKLGQFTIDESAVRTRFRYNTQGQLIEKLEAETFETLANGFVRRTRPTTSYGHDLLGRTVSIADANGNVNRQSYIGGSDRVATRFNADGASRTTGYDVFADARKLIDEMQGVVLQDFDALGRLVTVTRQGITRKQNFATGEFAGAVAVTNTLYERYEYDGLGQRTRRTDAAGAIEKTFYDARGRVVSTVSGSGATIQYQYTAVARGAADPVLGLGALDVGGYRRTTVNADARTLVDEIDYFGRTTWHQDLGGQRSDYVYGLSGRLMSQTSTGGQDIRYDYTMSGQLRQVRDVAASQRTVTQYAYDDAGNRTYEMYGKLNAQNDSVASILQSGNIQYDELNRIARSWDGSKSYDLRYEYDAVGNRRSAISTYWDVTGRVSERTDFWYTYDAMNRFTTTMGWLTGRGTSAGDTSTSIQIGNEGTSVRYNGLGQRIGVTYKDEADPNITHNERYEYSVDGYLEDAYLDNALVSRRRVDATGRTLQYKQWKGGVLQETKTTEFDADNRVRSEKVTDSQSGNGTTTYAYFQSASDNAAAATVDGRGALARTTFTPAAGGGSTVSTYVYQYWDTAKQSTITTTQPSGDPGKSTFTYDKNGHLASVVDTVARRELYYTTSAQGQVLQRDEIRRDLSGAPRFIHRYYYADGRRVGDVGNDGLSDRVSYAEQIARDAETPEQRRARSKNPTPVNSADFDQNYEPINAGYPVSASSRYTVRGGDTLSSIAQSVWGDAAMWYLLADANGLSGGEKLVEGQVLVIPNKVTNIHNNATTFRPYNPGEAMGNVNPTLPDPPPPPKKGGCGGIGMILMVVVAVVVTIYTAGAAAGVLGATVSGAGATAFSTGLAVMAGGTAAGVTVAGTAAMIAGAAIGAAVGSIASQVVGMATGNVDKFSWKAVGQSALAAGVTAGVGSYLGAAPGSTAASSNASTLTKVSDAVMRAGLNSAVTQAIQGKWSWREVGAASVSAGAGYFAGQAVSDVMKGADASVTRIAASAGAAVGASWASSQIMGYNSAETRARLSQAFISGVGQGLAGLITDPVNQAGAQPIIKTLSDGDAPRVERIDAEQIQKVGSLDLPELEPVPELRLPRTRVAGGGDSWARIARQEYGDERYALALAQANGAKSTFLARGQELQLPDLSGADLQAGGAMIAADAAARRPAPPVWSFREASGAQRLLDDGAQASGLNFVRSPGAGIAEIRNLSATEGFFTSTAPGRFLNGWAHGAWEVVKSPFTLVKEAVFTAGDAVGNLTYGAMNRALGGNQRYQNDSALFNSIEQNGVLGTAGLAMKSTVMSLPGVSQINALYRGNAYELGQSGATAAGYFAMPMASERVVTGANSLARSWVNLERDLDLNIKFIPDGVRPTEEFVTFFHGTSPEHAMNIRLNGVDPSLGKVKNDFGVGFYMTTSREEAIKSASMMSKASQDIIEFSVPRSELDLLKTKTFASADAEWASFVRANKTGSPIDIGDVDMIVGPMYGRVNSKGVMQQLGNRTQTSVHSQTAAEIFNYYMVRD